MWIGWLGALAVLPLDAAERDELNGIWIAESAELGGQPFPEEIRKSFRLTLQDNSYVVASGKTQDKGTIKVDSTATPKTMDIRGSEGPNKGKEIQAIYEFDGTTLKICYDLSGKARPTEFQSTAANQHLLVVYRREKK